MAATVAPNIYSYVLGRDNRMATDRALLQADINNLRNQVMLQQAQQAARVNDAYTNDLLSARSGYNNAIQNGVSPIQALYQNSPYFAAANNSALANAYNQSAGLTQAYAPLTGINGQAVGLNFGAYGADAFGSLQANPATQANYNNSVLDRTYNQQVAVAAAQAEQIRATQLADVLKQLRFSSTAQPNFGLDNTAQSPTAPVIQVPPQVPVAPVLPYGQRSSLSVVPQAPAAPQFNLNALPQNGPSQSYVNTGQGSVTGSAYPRTPIDAAPISVFNPGGYQSRSNNVALQFGAGVAY